MDIRVRVDSERTSQGFKEARRDVNRRTKEGLEEGGRVAVLPRVKAGAPSIVRQFLTIRATTRRAYVTTQGPRKIDRIAGLLNFGGIPDTPIVPREKQAVGPGVGKWVVARIDTPRIYHGKHFIERDVEASLPELERVMLPTLMRSYDGLQHEP